MHVSTDEMISRGSCSCQLCNSSQKRPALRIKGNLPRLRINLLELELMRGNWFAALVEDEETRAGGPLVDRPDKNILRATHDEVFQRIHKTRQRISL